MSTRQGLSFILIALGLAVSACASSKPVSEVDRLRAQAAYERGVTHLQERQPAQAMAALQEAVSIDGGVAAYRDTLGLVLMDMGRSDMAIEHLRRATEIDPKYADAHFHLGTALAESGRWEDAVASYRQALALPTLTVPDLAQQNLGLALYNLKRYRDAEQALRFAISLDPQMQAAYYNLGLVFVAENRKEEAKAAFRRARQLGPDSPFGQAAFERLKALGDGR